MPISTIHNYVNPNSSIEKMCLQGFFNIQIRQINFRNLTHKHIFHIAFGLFKIPRIRFQKCWNVLAHKYSGQSLLQYFKALIERFHFLQIFEEKTDIWVARFRSRSAVHFFGTVLFLWIIRRKSAQKCSHKLRRLWINLRRYNSIKTGAVLFSATKLNRTNFKLGCSSRLKPSASKLPFKFQNSCMIILKRGIEESIPRIANALSWRK